MFFGPNGMSSKKKCKTALNSLTQSYVTVISFCYYATDNYILVIKAKYDWQSWKCSIKN